MLALAACLGLLAQVAGPAAGPATKTPTEFRWSFLPSFGAIRFVIIDPPAGATHWSIELSFETCPHPEAFSCFFWGNLT